MIKNSIKYYYLKTILRTDILKFYNFLIESQYWSTDRITDYQNDHLRGIIEFIYNNVPFYKAKFKELDLTPSDIKTKDDLHKLPIVRRNDLKNNLKDFLSLNYKQYNPIQRFTSGTTGMALHFYIDRKAWGYGWAQKLRSWEWGDYKLGDNVGILAGGSLVPNQKILLSKKIWTWINNFHYMPIMHLNDSILNHYTELILSKQIQVLRGYPSALYAFAKYLKERRKTIPLKTIITTAEMLHVHQRKLIEEVFHCKIFDNYGCADGHGNANECEYHDGLHFSTETAILEILDSEGNEVNPGEEGEIVLTSFFNYSLPFIRYAPGDFAIKHKNERCECGRNLPLIKKIVGRTSDMIKLSNGRTLNGLSIPLETLKIDKFQIIQTKEDELLVKIVKGFASKKDISNLQNVIKYHAGDEIVTKLEIVKNIPTPVSGKFRFVISEIKK